MDDYWTQDSKKSGNICVMRGDVLATIEQLIAQASAAGKKVYVMVGPADPPHWDVYYEPENWQSSVWFSTLDEDFMQWVCRQTFFDKFEIGYPGNVPLKYLEMLKDTRFNVAEIDTDYKGRHKVTFLVDKDSRRLTCPAVTLLMMESVCYLKHCDLIRVLAFTKEDVGRVGAVLCLRLDQPIEIDNCGRMSVEEWQSLDVLRHRKGVTFVDDSAIALTMNMWLMSL
jgi:hypothetical protein